MLMFRMKLDPTMEIDVCFLFVINVVGEASLLLIAAGGRELARPKVAFLDSEKT
jgi:hypothetical protein